MCASEDISCTSEELRDEIVFEAPYIRTVTSRKHHVVPSRIGKKGAIPCATGPHRVTSMVSCEARSLTVSAKRSTRPLRVWTSDSAPHLLTTPLKETRSPIDDVSSSAFTSTKSSSAPLRSRAGRWGMIIDATIGLALSSSSCGAAGAGLRGGGAADSRSFTTGLWPLSSTWSRAPRAVEVEVSASAAALATAAAPPPSATSSIHVRSWNWTNTGTSTESCKSSSSSSPASPYALRCRFRPPWPLPLWTFRASTWTLPPPTR